MKLIVGLGNPGPEYARTRHNVGFRIVDHLSQRLVDLPLVWKSKFHGLVTDANGPGGERCLLMKPMTYVNRSGQAVAEAARFYKLEAAQILVIVDDVSLGIGEMRLRGAGSDGGHNGLCDIQRGLGTDMYARLRFGIGDPGTLPRRDYVLGRFTTDEEQLIQSGLDRTADAVCCWIEQGLDPAMNRYNKRRSRAPRPPADRDPDDKKDESINTPDPSPSDQYVGHRRPDADDHEMPDLDGH